MELEAWHLLILPLFFALGWAAARVDIRHVVRESRAVPQSYFKGLNYLLNEQPDKAIEAFLEVARMDPDTLELHFALGALFRRRGELDRAIRIHQNLVDRADLPQDTRMKAMYELGEDYFKAGLLDRAETVFRRLESGSLALDALRNILNIQVLTKDWNAAIQTADRLERLGSPAQQTDAAHYHCELAAAAMLKNDAGAAREELGRALERNPRAARAWLLLGDLEAGLGRDEAAIEAWRKVEGMNPTYLPLLAERLVQAFSRLGRQEDAVRLLRAYLERQPSADLTHTLFQTVAQQQGWPAARQLAAEELRRRPHLRALDDYLQAGNSVNPDAVEDRLAQDLVHRQVSLNSFYQCVECGFKARQHFWQCPACARWESIPPERTQHD
ncbi:MAG: lipopolysaccharide assembly protein LapB [Betaproteobacteria bacterium]|nr:lipopolysaccharide assembly protein LapB [Betaproteobacteria bacterium]